jgi:hypothetical protein
MAFSPIMSLLFTGHMIDLPDRQTPRFSPDMEYAAGEAISRSINSATASSNTNLIGLSSGARGGDILFHEACRTVGISTRIILPFEPEIFIETSVAGVASGNWTERFWKLWRDTPENHREVLGLPQNNQAYAACNLRLIEAARARGRFHLIALWDGKGGDGPGGTAHMVAEAKQATDNPDIIRPQDLVTKGTAS